MKCSLWSVVYEDFFFFFTVTLSQLGLIVCDRNTGKENDHGSPGMKEESISYNLG